MVRRVRILSVYKRQLDKRGNLSPGVGKLAPHRTVFRGDVESPSATEVLRKRELAQRLSVNPWTLDRWRKSNPTFPQPIWLSATTPVWFAVEIDAWLSSRPRGGLAPSWTRTAPRRFRKHIKVREATDAR